MYSQQSIFTRSEYNVILLVVACVTQPNYSDRKCVSYLSYVLVVVVHRLSVFSFLRLFKINSSMAGRLGLFMFENA